MFETSNVVQLHLCRRCNDYSADTFVWRIIAKPIGLSMTDSFWDQRFHRIR